MPDEILASRRGYCLCANCDGFREVGQHGECETCGSESILKMGAIKALRDYIRGQEPEPDLPWPRHRPKKGIDKP